VRITIEPEVFDPYSYPLEPSWFHKPHDIHGLSHTRRVLIHACTIGASVGLQAAEFESVVLSAAWHDIGRTHDGRDPEHGAKSVARIHELGLDADVRPLIMSWVLFAVELHSTDDEIATRRAASTNNESMLRVLWTLKDADGLDRVRISDLDPRQLRYRVSRDRVRQGLELFAQLP
jgi:HD superfamily phosphodiesterase